mmetsp:Transcript_62351/g.142746  ORF Transcript_62351/g.142746 Transcript_62351/m.142746 type:complete len:253 (-) Transcript_62351:399-1157(-)
MVTSAGLSPRLSEKARCTSEKEMHPARNSFGRKPASRGAPGAGVAPGAGQAPAWHAASLGRKKLSSPTSMSCPMNASRLLHPGTNFTKSSIAFRETSTPVLIFNVTSQFSTWRALRRAMASLTALGRFGAFSESYSLTAMMSARPTLLGAIACPSCGAPPSSRTMVLQRSPAESTVCIAVEKAGQFCQYQPPFGMWKTIFPRISLHLLRSTHLRYHVLSGRVFPRTGTECRRFICVTTERSRRLCLWVHFPA